jgi:hypothetical protein
MIPLTDEEQNRYDQSQTCVRCKETFSNENPKVRLHNHRTGKFVDALCNRCNLQVKDRAMIPVVFHNLKNYDAHHVFRSFNKRIAAKYDKKGRQSFKNVKVIALNLERYVSFETQYLPFHRFLSVLERASRQTSHESTDGVSPTCEEVLGR